MKDLAAIVRHYAAAQPEAVATEFEGRATGYGELDRRASRAANGLRAIDPTPGTRVALIDKNSDAFFEVLFGAAKAGHVPVPVSWRLAPPEVASILNDARAEVLFVGPECWPTVEKIRDELRTVTTVIALPGGHPTWEGYEAWRDRQAADDPALPIAGGDVALLVYTSGTTGRPKGVQLTHDNLFANLPVGVRAMGGWTPADVNLVCMPVSHVAGTIWATYGFYCGARNVVLRDVDPAAILQTIPARRVTTALFVPAVLRFLLQTPGCRETDLSSLRLVVYGASPIPLELLRGALATFRCDFGQVYGLTETTGAITYLPPRDHDPAGNRRMLSCGRPLSSAEIKVVDERGAELPPGRVGEILCRSRQVMKGYWNRPEETAEAIRDGWLRTGDAGYADEDGYLYVYDRIKDLIISGGENVYPVEVESVLSGHPAVADVAVIGVPDDRWGEAVKAIVARKPGAEATAEELIALAREHIAGYKVPKSVDFVEALPRNPSGKILKRVLRAPYWAGRERQVN